MYAKAAKKYLVDIGITSEFNRMILNAAASRKPENTCEIFSGEDMSIEQFVKVMGGSYGC